MTRNLTQQFDPAIRPSNSTSRFEFNHKFDPANSIIDFDPAFDRLI